MLREEHKSASENKKGKASCFFKRYFYAMNRILVFLLLLILPSLFKGLEASEKRFQHFTTSEGLSYNTVFDIDQDQNGFLWIATGEGLNRYDSYGFKVWYADKSGQSIPSNEVRALLVTQTGTIMAGTTEGLCIYNPDYDNFSHVLYENRSLGYIHDIIGTSKDKLLISSRTGIYYATVGGVILERLPLEPDMLQIREDHDGTFWSFKRQRLFHFDETGNLLKIFYVGPEGFPTQIPSSISSIDFDSRNRLWIGTFRDGPVLLDVSESRFRPVPIKTYKGGAHPMYFVRDVTEDSEGKFWIGTERGLFIYDLEEAVFEHYLQSFDPSVAPVNDNAIYKIFRSRENIMWLGTYFGGLNLCEPMLTGFKTIKPGIREKDLQGKALSQIIKGPDGNLWIATEDAGIAIYNREESSFTHILAKQRESFPQISSNVHALALDRQGFVWSGNFYGGINRINPTTFQTQNFSHINLDSTSLVNNFVFSLYFDDKGLLWIGTMDGVDCFETTGRNFVRFKPGIFRGKFIYDIFQDRSGNYWFCANDNTGIYRYDRENDKLSHFVKDSTENLLGSSFICHYIDSRGKIWFGSRGGGVAVFDPDTREFKSYDMEDGLPNNVVYGILEDDQNNLWLSTNKGISKFNYITGEIRNFTVDHGLVGNQFNYKSFYKSEDGTLWFGAVNGLTWFHPKQIKTFESEPEIHFTNFRLFNEPVRPGKKSVLEKDIDLTEHITLNYHQNVISFDFIALDYHSRGKNNFFYYMDGFESTWQSAGNHQSVTYTNLPPGDYFFRIKATNIYNFPNDLIRSIKVTIRPPFYRTFWAYLGYFILLGTSIFLLLRFYEIRHREKMALKIEKIGKEKLQELHQHKINFFTYISHEFKTPLTIILASLDAFFSADKIPEPLANKVITLKRNVLRLQFLINQLMDFRKVETDHATTNLQYGNVIQFLREIFEAFTTLFKRKELEYIFIAPDKSLFINFDPDKLEKIVSNLLSNAFKYTPEHGEITFRIETPENEGNSCLQLTVTDTGTGMTKEQLEKIFNLFYKIENEQNEYQGSGIGLTLTQSLVKTLNGTISVESKPGEGTSFIVKLPYTTESEPAEATGKIPLNMTVIENLMNQSLPETLFPEKEEENHDFEIFFVEDDREFLKFLCTHFREKYRATALPNGLEAWNLIHKKIPDLIVTDLMMPGMDGITLCRKLKTSFEFCHVPVIMLTSRSDMESRLESLEVGADVYLPKPFLLSELELQIKNILISKENLKKHFIQFGKIELDHPLKNKEQQFIEKISRVICSHLDDPEFGVSGLTAELGIGRTLLHTKLKQILDLSTTEFINTIRLREAQKLLIENQELTMSEIAYKVGFNDPNYFSRTFRKLFNISPTDFRNEKVRDREAGGQV